MNVCVFACCTRDLAQCVLANYNEFIADAFQQQTMPMSY